MSVLTRDPLTLAEALAKMPRHERLAIMMPLVRDDVRDKSYELLPLGQEVKRYLAAQRKRFTDSSMRTYEHVLVQLVKAFPDLELKDFELPVGAQRLEEFMDERWGAGSRGSYNVNHSILSEFFKWHVRRGHMQSNPAALVDRARKPDVYRSVFTNDQRLAILASAANPRDRIALRLLLDYGIRKGALLAIQFRHFDHQRRHLTVFTKGQKIRRLPLPDPALWLEIERLVQDWEAEIDHYLMCVIKPIPRAGIRRFPNRPMSSTAAHRWWYARLREAGVVPTGTTSGEKMHKARHSAGQRVLDASGDLKLVQKLLGHASIQTTGDVYVDYDIDQLASKLRGVMEGEDA